ncbi:Hypothetical_protein [Hexamita inflata]|uniref:Hypothetical_protein n=2 Tax=Hexamita inflata TaxID=28002 RepID=A0AA86UTS2_9EUKA|nr:Hypothetical protein HINF_LOCUS59055 [Hexamita inflata]
MQLEEYLQQNQITLQDLQTLTEYQIATKCKISYTNAQKIYKKIHEQQLSEAQIQYNDTKIHKVFKTTIQQHEVTLFAGDSSAQQILMDILTLYASQNIQIILVSTRPLVLSGLRESLTSAQLRLLHILSITEQQLHQSAQLIQNKQEAVKASLVIFNCIPDSALVQALKQSSAVLVMTDVADSYTDPSQESHVLFTKQAQFSWNSLQQQPGFKQLTQIKRRQDQFEANGFKSIMYENKVSADNKVVFLKLDGKVQVHVVKSARLGSCSFQVE